MLKLILPKKSPEVKNNLVTNTVYYIYTEQTLTNPLIRHDRKLQWCACAYIKLHHIGVSGSIYNLNSFFVN